MWQLGPRRSTQRLVILVVAIAALTAAGTLVYGSVWPALGCVATIVALVLGEGALQRRRARKRATVLTRTASYGALVSCL